MKSTEFLDWRHGDDVGNLVDLLRHGAEQHPNRVFVAHNEVKLSYGDALKAARGFAALYENRMHNKVVAIAMPNSISALTTYLSVLYSGGTPALLNSNMPPKAATALLTEINPTYTITEPDVELDAQFNQLKVDMDTIYIWMDADCGHASICGSGTTAATYLCTGGTTGVPKRVCYSHDQVLSAGERMQWGWPMNAGEVYLPIAPFSHIYGFLMGVCVPLQTGGTSVFMDRFHPKTVLETIQNQKVSVLGGGPPAIYQALLSQDDLEQYDLSSLRVCPGGGAPFPVAVLDEWQSRTGLVIYEGYGMTEVAPIAVNTADLGRKNGAAGKPVPDLDIRILSLDGDESILPAGQAGEICIKAPHLMTGYVDAEEETAQVLTDGWMKTGDVGVIDEDGFLVITDRKKDVILHKGFNVFPREVEETLLSYAEVSTACVVGAPDQRHGERVVAFITLRDGATYSEEALLTHCKDYLVSYRLPGQIERLETMPLTPAGKVDRIALREAARANTTTKIAV